MCDGLLSGRLRVAVAVCAILASPAFRLSAQGSQSFESPARAITTMSGMRSLVPSLVAAGWENFFLDLRQDLWTVTVVPKPHTHAPGAHHHKHHVGRHGQEEAHYEEV